MEAISTPDADKPGLQSLAPVVDTLMYASCSRRCENRRNCYLKNFDSFSFNLCRSATNHKYISVDYGETGLTTLWRQSSPKYLLIRTGQKICTKGKSVLSCKVYSCSSIQYRFDCKRNNYVQCLLTQYERITCS